jgi:hypothetical protein
VQTVPEVLEVLRSIAAEQEELVIVGKTWSRTTGVRIGSQCGHPPRLRGRLKATAYDLDQRGRGLNGDESITTRRNLQVQF